MTQVICFTTGDKLKQRLDNLRGDIPRSKFIVRMLESQIFEIEKGTNNRTRNKLENISFSDDIFHTDI